MVRGSRILSKEEFATSLEKFDELVRSRFLMLAGELERLTQPANC